MSVLQKGARMLKHAMVATLVLCFVCTFLTMIYQYGSHGWAYESSVPHMTHAGSQHFTPEEGKGPADSVEHHPNADQTALPSNAGETPSHAEPAVETAPDMTSQEAVSPTPGQPPTGGEAGSPVPTPDGGANQTPIPSEAESATSQNPAATSPTP